MLDRLKKLLANPRFPGIAAALATVLFLPVLDVGLMMDDYLHRVTYEGGLQFAPRPDWDLFRFVGPDRAEFARSRDFGAVPWWAPQDFRLAFFRPLSGISHRIDYRYFPDHPAIMHAENILLFAGMVFVVGLLYRRFMAPAWAAGLATLLFAWDDAHAFVVVWIANRNALLAGFFGLLALWLHDRARRDGARAAGILAPLALALGLLSGEAALSAIAYLVAYALFLDDRAPRERLKSLGPYLVVSLMWAVVYKVRGYGSAGSGFYVDPVGEPLAFALAIIKRLPMLLLGQLGLPPVDLWPQTGGTPVGLLLAATAVLVGLGLVFVSVLRKDRACRFFAAGMLLSLLPVCATLPNDRLLLFSGFGAFGLVATFLSRAFAVEKPEPRTSARVVAWAMIVVHVVLAPLILPLRARTMGQLLHQYIVNSEKTLPANVGSTLVVVNAPDPLVAGLGGAIRIYADRSAISGRLRLLTIATEGESTAERIDDHTLSLYSPRRFFHDPMSQIFRNPSNPFHVGEVANEAGMRVEVMEVTAEGLPRRIHVRFDEALDDPSLVWVTWVGQGFILWKPPAPGEKVTVAPVSLPEALTGQKQ